MANVSDKVAQIRQAVYGKDVRESIAASIEVMNDESKSAYDTAQHAPRISSATGNWEIWSITANAYTDTGKPARGETGPQGPKGDTGPQGEKGDTGPSFEYGESYDTLAALQSAYPSGDTKGHLVGGTAYVWDGTAWVATSVDLSEYDKRSVADARYAGINHTHTAAQVGARPDTWMPTAADVGARPDTWMPTAADVGARPDTWMPTAADVGAAAKSTAVSITLAAANWAGTSAPYTQTLSIVGVTATSNQEFLPALDITTDQLTALQSANIVDGGQAAGSITLKAYGDKPGIDLPVRVIIRRDL